MRFFSGDNPARQFEAGQQRGGNFSCICGIPSNDHLNLQACFKRSLKTLEERRELVLSGNALNYLEKGDVNPFQNLRKDALEDELDMRGVEITDMKKPELKSTLQELLSGISRPPALAMEHPTKNMKDHNLENYEVFCCEPLHDIANMVKNFPAILTTKRQNQSLKAFPPKQLGTETRSKDPMPDCLQ